MANLENFCGSAMTFDQIHAARIISSIYELLDSDYKNMLSLCECVKTGAIQVNRAKREILAIWKHFKRYSIIFRDIEWKYFPKPDKIQGNYNFLEDMRNVRALRGACNDIIIKVTE